MVMESYSFNVFKALKVAGRYIFHILKRFKIMAVSFIKKHAHLCVNVPILHYNTRSVFLKLPCCFVVCTLQYFKCTYYFIPDLLFWKFRVVLWVKESLLSQARLILIFINEKWPNPPSLGLPKGTIHPYWCNTCQILWQSFSWKLKSYHFSNGGTMHTV